MAVVVEPILKQAVVGRFPSPEYWEEADRSVTLAARVRIDRCYFLPIRSHLSCMFRLG